MGAEEKEKTWVKIVPAVIAGAATVLAAMLPLYCSSQRQLQAETQKSDHEVDALQTQVATLRRQVQNCEAARAQLTPQNVPSPRIPQATLSGAIGEVVDHDFRFSLKGCQADGSTVKCDLIVTNLMGDRELSLADGRIIADSGDEYPKRRITLGAHSGTFARMILPGMVPVKAAITFASVRPGTKQLEVLELIGYNWPESGSRQTINATFRKVSIASQ